ncbi:MAG: N(4)-(beta-N-acetylglucosaminyl)-L-asparaginase [Gracilimonas sp.]|nr:N(4)-(beta-N-acetylglucosaminyl)-L-asparaginase [Gracilimonas sp.]
MKTSIAGLVPVSFSGILKPKKFTGTKPVVISTWKTAKNANKAAWSVLSKGGYALDAVEKGVKVEEANPKNSTVGYGGRPDRDGNVTLDACVMDEKGDCGSVMYLENMMHPVSVARKVMTDTPHSILVGAGAKKFALESGFKEEDLLTEESKKAWKKWLEKEDYNPEINVENHDTIGMLALDEKGRISGACTTSGAAWKMNGRVGDSPIIGSGLFIDPKIGGAVATGLGEEVIKTAGSHLVVEMMRAGHSPEEACKIAVERIIERNPDNKKGIQVAYIALNVDGAFGGYSIQDGFDAVVTNTDGQRVQPMNFLV